MISKYIINHKNKGYTGKSACVFFIDGVCEINNEWIASWFERKGHLVEKIEVELEGNILESTNSDFIPESDDPEDIDNIDYSKLKLEELREIAKNKNIIGYENMKKIDLVDAIEGDI